MSKIGHFPEAWRQTVFPDRSVLIGEKIESFQSKRASFIWPKISNETNYQNNLDNIGLYGQ